MFKRIIASLIIVGLIMGTAFADTLKYRPSSGGSTYYTWTTIAGTSQNLVAANAYVPTASSLTTFTLPVSPTLGDHYLIAGSGSGGWKLAQNSGQSTIIGIQTTTTGASGYLASTSSTDTIEIVYIGSSIFKVIGIYGNITFN